MRILVVTDAWHPQVNGVVRTYERLAIELAAIGVEMSVLAPHDFRTLPCPTYPEIRLAVPGLKRVAQRFGEVRPDAVHIATEGPIGWMARRYCTARRIPFTTSFHTRFPDVLSTRKETRAEWTSAVQGRCDIAGGGGDQLDMSAEQCGDRLGRALERDHLEASHVGANGLREQAGRDVVMAADCGGESDADRLGVIFQTLGEIAPGRAYRCLLPPEACARNALEVAAP